MTRSWTKRAVNRSGSHFIINFSWGTLAMWPRRPQSVWTYSHFPSNGSPLEHKKGHFEIKFKMGNKISVRYKGKIARFKVILFFKLQIYISQCDFKYINWNFKSHFFCDLYFLNFFISQFVYKVTIVGYQVTFQDLKSHCFSNCEYIIISQCD